MQLTILPHKSVGELRFGESREAVRRLLGRRRFQSFQKGDGPILTDTYDGSGFQLYYGRKDRLEAVEMFEPAVPTLGRTKFLGRKLAAAAAALKRAGYKSKATDVGLRFNSAGIALTAPYGVVEGVLAFRRGYFD